MPILIILCAVGGFFGLPNPWFHFPPAALLFPFCLTWIAFRAATGKQAFLLGWLGGFMALFAMFYWTAWPVYRYGGLPWVLAAFAPVFISGLLGLYFALYSLIMHHGARKLSGLPLILASGVFWALAEHLNSFVLSGFPWNALSSGFAAWPLTVQGASLVGAYGLSGLLASLAVALLLFNTARAAWVWTFVVVAFLGSYGAVRLDTFPAQEDGITMTLVQGNVDQAVKWDAGFQAATIERYANLTDAALANHRADLVIWPETALPFYFQESSPATGAVLEYLLNSGITLLTGAPAYENQEGTRNYSLRNRAFLVDAGASTLAWYDKEHLVPFGEYMPLPDWFGLEKLAQGVGDYTSGENDHRLRLGPAELGLLICYEATFPNLAQRRVERGANVLVNISNDSWFGDSSAPPQHLAHASLRAVEQGRYLARCTNNGITAFIDPVGRVVARMERKVAGSLTHPVKPVEVTTIYHDFYHWELRLLYLAAALFLLRIVFGARRVRDRGRWKL